MVMEGNKRRQQKAFQVFETFQRGEKESQVYCGPLGGLWGRDEPYIWWGGFWEEARPQFIPRRGLIDTEKVFKNLRQPSHYSQRETQQGRSEVGALRSNKGNLHR